MIRPTIGRIMWYWPEKEYRSSLPWAAIVTNVHNDNMINLSVFNADGHHMAKSSVPVVQEGSPYTASDSPYVEWMPYQIGQAKTNSTKE
jgi:hypothetical protein